MKNGIMIDSGTRAGSQNRCSNAGCREHAWTSCTICGKDFCTNHGIVVGHILFCRECLRVERRHNTTVAKKVS